MVSLFKKTLRKRASFSKRPLVPLSGPSFSGQTRDNGWKPVRLDKTITFICFAFVLVGLIFTYSSSAFDSSSFFIRQVIFDTMGLIAAAFLSQMYLRLQKMWIFRPIHLMYVTWVFLVIVLFSRTQANVHRWIDFGFFKLQPSEIAKVTLVIYMSYYLESVAGHLAKNWRLLIQPFCVAGITLGLILAERDLGTPILMGSVFVVMLIVSGTRILHLVVPGIPIGLFVAYQILFVKYRRDRLFSFLNPFAQEGTVGYQLSRSLLAVSSGGWLGKGLGNSELKLEYLPAAHTDFIFSIMCEELGLFRISFILGGFCWLLIRGISLARVAKTHAHALLIFGLTITICLQAFFNMAMAIGLLPTKGIALPFFSYGGSSVIMTLVMIGIILNVAGTDNPQQNLQNDFNRRNR